MRLHRFRSGDPDNPYFGILALADAFIVSSDSVAMLSEAAATGRDVHIFDLGASDAEGRDVTAKSLAYRAMMALLPKRLSRDIGLFHDAFVAHGYGTWSNEPCARSRIASHEAEQTVERVRALAGARQPQLTD